MYLINSKIKRGLYFFLGGAINTFLTYAVYIILNSIIDYQWAYFFAYILGIIFSYWFNAWIVFKVRLSWTVFFSYPLVYLIQYSASALLLEFFVRHGINEKWSPLVVAVIVAPSTYIASKLLLVRSNRSI
ncbi:TPA: GtrA family protein [Legionella pneumophila]|uniref:GtrA family protein n=1 Tax=Legionella pneumophila TaxID=446 RepID=UPI00048B4CF4|nr:GtrA family protein [Legionella pneumophila]HAT9803844.1 GtrA family protein [Legionella pneumophila subsp. pneumophila]HAT4006522.1 GtrA family protein [Legionella pneumophila]HAT6361448.1 GtrA family protein [Legionella pneumophila]HAT6368541.1 GtrA family protein [Legionella pneumophila]